MKRSPNIIIVLADDMGFGDVGCYDPAFCKVPTPNIDRLARGGMMFTDAHTASSLCSPSRYALLTGRYAWRTRLQNRVLVPYDPPLIATDRLTLPALLKQQGYNTACIGKWHLGWDWPLRNGEVVFDEPLGGGPITRGFDSYFGTDVPNYPPYTFIENDLLQGELTVHIEKDPGLVLHHPGPAEAGWRFDQVLPTITERAVTYIQEQANQSNPFFLYFSLTTPHEPVAPSARFKGKSGISGVADLIMETDWALGEVMIALEQTNSVDDTLLIFTTDNGHCTYTGLEPFERVGHRVSGPFRGYKADIWEGGHRVPFVARWPTEILAATRCGQTIGLVDILATCADLLQIEFPDNAGEDSISILPLLNGGQEPVRETSIYHSGRGNFAIFEGPWKLALCPDSGGYWSTDQPTSDKTPPAQLYNLITDPHEEHNLYAQYSDVVEWLGTHLAQAISDGRSTPGVPQKNDVEVDVWK